MATHADRLPTFFISHGGGPWPWMEGMVDEAATVFEALDPSGLVKCRGELWTAETETGEHLKAGASVRVVRFRGMTLVVRPDEKEGK